MKSITQHHASAPAPGRGHPAIHPARGQRLRLRGRAHAASAGAGLLGAAAIAAVLLASSLPASATQAPPSARTAGLTAAGPADDGRLEATFTNSDVSVTPGLGMVELLATGTGTVEGFGAATEVVGVILDTAVSPCGPGGASDSAQRRIVMTGGVQGQHRNLRRCPRVRPRHRRRHHPPRSPLRDTDPGRARGLTGPPWPRPPWTPRPAAS